MIELFPYQKKAVSHAVDMIFKRKNSLIVAGTGAGKTIMMASAIGRFFYAFKSIEKRSPHVLVLVHRNEIHTQNHDKFSLVCPNIATSQITQKRKSLKGNVHFGMVQTVFNLLGAFENTDIFFDMIVIDEAHHGVASTYESIIDWNKKRNPDACILGVTATPNRGDKIPLLSLFNNFYQITTDYLIKSHYLTKPVFLDLSPTFKREDDSTEKGHLAKNIKDDEKGNETIKELIKDYLDNKEEGQTIIFCPSHSFCERVYKILTEYGRNPAYLGLNLDDVTRKEELRRFEEKECEELINVDICTEGYDYPPIRNLVDFDTNGTHSQWVQKVGRVLRTFPNKTSCTVMDFGGNIELYPDGVETDVNLEGAGIKEENEKLTEEDFFLTEKKENVEFSRNKKEFASSEVLKKENKAYTPYNLPKGFESINDADLGIVFVACTKERDCIIIEEKNDVYGLYTTNKTSISKSFSGSFSQCVFKGIEYVGVIEVETKPVTKTQIMLLAPEYPTNTLDFNSANCCLCFKAWKKELKN